MREVRKCTQCGRIIKADSKTGLCTPCLRKSIREKVIGGGGVVGIIGLAVKNPESLESILGTINKLTK